MYTVGVVAIGCGGGYPGVVTECALLFLVLGCAAPALEVPLPVLDLSADELTFSAAAGGFSTGTFTVTNEASPSDEAAPYTPALALGDGAADPGISPTDGPFCLHWDTPACADVAARGSGAAELCADGVAEGGDTLRLPAGCALPITVVYAPTEAGENLGAARVLSAFGPWPLTELPEVWEAGGDPTEPVQEVALRGTASATPVGRFVVGPPLAPFPWHWPDGAADEVSFTLTNTGTAPARVGEPDLSCSSDWALGGASLVGTELASGESAAFTVVHTAVEPDAEVCTLTFSADSGVASAGSVLRFGPDTWSQPPEILITAPASGVLAPAADPVLLTFEVSDDEAPASGVFITAWSTAQKLTLAQGYGPGEAGPITLTIAPGDLLPGPETLRVSLLDWEGFTSFDAVAFRVETSATDDADGDAWGLSEGDCDDANPQAFPGAVETADGVDEDCDGTVDDGAAPLDNDGDGATETEGDCNDHDRDVRLGAPETANNVDDDCDGVVDEETQRYDDDGDGYSELIDDCDDADSEVHPAATDRCDGVDRDCDSVILPCPETLGGAFLRISPDVCHAGESVELQAVAPAAATTFAWTVDAGVVADATAASTTLTCPDSEGAVQVALVVSDASGHQAFDSGKIEVVAEDRSLAGTVTLTKGGCAGGGVLGFLGVLAGWAVRRRAARPA